MASDRRQWRRQVINSFFYLYENQYKHADRFREETRVGYRKPNSDKTNLDDIYNLSDEELKDFIITCKEDAKLKRQGWQWVDVIFTAMNMHFSEFTHPDRMRKFLYAVDDEEVLKAMDNTVGDDDASLCMKAFFTVNIERARRSAGEVRHAGS